MTTSDKKDAKRQTGQPLAPRLPQRDDQPLKQMNEDPDEVNSPESDDDDGLPPDSGKFEGRDPVPREDYRKSTDKKS